MTPWTVAHQAPPSMGFSRQEYWSGVPLPSPCWYMQACVLSHVRLFAAAWTVTCQVPLSMGFSSQDTGMGCYLLLQRIFPTQGLNPHLLCFFALQAYSLQTETLGKPHLSTRDPPKTQSSVKEESGYSEATRRLQQRRLTLFLWGNVPLESWVPVDRWLMHKEAIHTKGS